MEGKIVGRRCTLEVGQEAVHILAEPIQRTFHPIDFGYIAQSGHLHILVQGTILVLGREIGLLVQGMVRSLERYLGEDILDTVFLQGIQVDCCHYSSHQARVEQIESADGRWREH